MERHAQCLQLRLMLVMMMAGVVGVGVTTAFSLPDHDVTSVPPALSSTSVPQGSGGDECDGGLPPPDLPFRVVWNHPDTCEKNHLPLHLDQYGFIFNKRRTFLGEEVQTLYPTGHWPFISKTGQFSNGGLPQLFNHTDYNRTREVLSQHRVDNFTGLAIIDFEAWRAIFGTNYSKLKKYQLESLKLVRRRHPNYNDTMLRAVAEREWQEAVRRIMSTKLAIGQALMPGGHWGYYSYPRNWGPNGNTARQNNKIEWLWRQSTGLYPRIYMADPNQAESAKIYRVSVIVGEAVRVQHEFSPPNTPIYPFGNMQSGDDIFFQEDHLEISIGLPAKLGASGVVLWGSSSHYKHAFRQCSRLQEHMRTVLGPFVKNLTQVMADCSTALCGGHGRCVHNSHDVLLGETESLRLSGLCAPRDSRFRDYHCRCYSSWEGACCQTRRPSRCQTQQEGNVQGTGHVQHGPVVNGTATLSTTTTPRPDAMNPRHHANAQLTG